MIAATIRSLMLARCALDGRLDGQFDSRLTYGGVPVARASRAWRPTPGRTTDRRRSFARCTRSATFNLLKAGNRFTLADLLRGLDAIHQADLALKTTGQAEGVILETLALTLCGGDAPKG